MFLGLFVDVIFQYLLSFFIVFSGCHPNPGFALRPSQHPVALWFVLHGHELGDSHNKTNPFGAWAARNASHVLRIDPREPQQMDVQIIGAGKMKWPSLGIWSSVVCWTRRALCLDLFAKGARTWFSWRFRTTADLEHWRCWLGPWCWKVEAWLRFFPPSAPSSDMVVFPWWWCWYNGSGSQVEVVYTHCQVWSLWCRWMCLLSPMVNPPRFGCHIMSWTSLEDRQMLADIDDLCTIPSTWWFFFRSGSSSLQFRSPKHHFYLLYRWRRLTFAQWELATEHASWNASNFSEDMTIDVLWYA